MRQSLAQPAVRRLLGAGLLSQSGDWVLRIGLAYEVYVLTGSTVASALLLLASFAPQLVLGSLAGVFVDRWDPKRTMIAANLLRTRITQLCSCIRSRGRLSGPRRR